MGDKSAIEWTDATWNPVRGCTKITPGCKHCYAETFAERFRGVAGHPFEQGFDLRLIPEKLTAPLRWRSSRRIFVNSMSDLFHEDVPTDYIAKVGSVMRQADWHTYQVLTKRRTSSSVANSTGWPNFPTFGMASAWRIASMACHASIVYERHPRESDFYPLNLCWKIWET